MPILTKLRQLFKKPDKGPVAEADDVVRVVKTAGTSVADALTPARLITLLRSADQGDLKDQIDLFEAMEDRDAKLDGFMRQRKLGLLSHEWELREPEDGTKDSATKSIDLCKQVLDGIAAFDDQLFHLLDALGKGFAACEIMWESSEKQWWPRGLEWRSQSWFTLDEKGEDIHLKTEAEQVWGEPLNPMNWILHKHRARSGFIPRVGLYRACCRPFLVRNFGQKDWLAFAEVYGMPLRVGKLRQGASVDEKRMMWAALQSLGIDAAALIPEGSEIEFPTVGQGGAASSGVFKDLIAQAEDDYVIAILGQRLTTGGEEGGSYALGEVHNAVRHDLMRDDAKRLSATVREQLFAPVVHLNLGPTAPVPELAFDVEPPEDVVQLSEVVKNLVGGGAGSRIPGSWINEKFNIPEPKAGEETLGSSAPPPTVNIDPLEVTAPGESAPEVAAKSPFHSSLADAISRARSSKSDSDSSTDGSSNHLATHKSYGIKPPSKRD